MEKLHRRIRRFSNSLRCLVVAASFSSPAFAQNETPRIWNGDPITSESLSEWSGQLASQDPAVRQQAAGRFRQLAVDSLPAIRARIRQWPREGVARGAAVAALDAFRDHAIQLSSDAEPIDLELGVLPRLAEAPGVPTARMAERLLVVRALENMISIEAGAELVRILAMDYAMWQREVKRAIERQQGRLMPMLVLARAHDAELVRRWASQRARELGRPTMTDTVQETDPRVLAEILRGHGIERRTEAMDLLIGFVDHPRRIVREAARWAIGQYEHNAIWKFRRAYQLETGERAASNLNWRQLSHEIYRRMDLRRVAIADEPLRRGIAALEAEDFGAMQREFEAVLALVPDHPRAAELGLGYAKLAEQEQGAHRIENARLAYSRALSLATDHPLAANWRANTAYLLAEQRRATGVLDVDGYQIALSHDDAHSEAQAALEALVDSAEAPALTPRRVAGTLGAVLLIAVAVSVARARRRPAPERRLDDPEAATEELLDTLPG